MSDGGEGFLDALGGANRTTTVTGPLGDPVEAGWRLDGRRAVVEMAQASGISLVGRGRRQRPGRRRHPRHRRGRSPPPSRPGPAGCSSAWAGRPPPTAASAPCGPCTPCPATGASSWSWPATSAPASSTPPPRVRPAEGGDGGPGRAADPAAGAPGPGVHRGPRHRRAPASTGRRRRGLAGGLAAIGAALVEGFEVVAEEADLYGRIEGADLVVTGEGFLDAQSFEGKVVGGVAGLAAEAGVPVVAIVGGGLRRRRASDRGGVAGASASVRSGPATTPSRCIEEVALGSQDLRTGPSISPLNLPHSPEGAGDQGDEDDDPHEERDRADHHADQPDQHHGGDDAADDRREGPGTGLAPAPPWPARYRASLASAAMGHRIRRAGSARLGRGGHGAVLVGLLGIVAWFFRVIWPPLILAGAIVFILNPVVTFLQKRHIPRALGTAPHLPRRRGARRARSAWPSPPGPAPGRRPLRGVAPHPGRPRGGRQRPPRTLGRERLADPDPRATTTSASSVRPRQRR